MENPFENGGIIDSRDVIEYRDELEGAITSHKEQLERWEFDGDERPGETSVAIAEFENELEKLQEFIGECENYNSDFPHGTTLIPESEFEDYAQDLVKDIGDLPQNLPAYLVIDWAATAENLKVDYTEVEYEGTTYFILNT